MGAMIAWGLEDVHESDRTPGSSLAQALWSAHDLELLHPPAPIGLRHVDAAFGIDREGVTMGEIAELMAGAAEARKDLPAGVVEGMHLLGAAIHHIHELLLAIGRERHPPRGAALVRKLAGCVGDRNVAHERSVLLVDLDAIALAVACVDLAGIAHGDAGHDLREHAGPPAWVSSSVAWRPH